MLGEKASAFIARRGEEIVAKWEEEVRRQIPEARAESSLRLKDHIPAFLDELASLLSGVKDVENVTLQPVRLESEALGGEHGRKRAEAGGYAVPQVAREFVILRRVIMRALSEAELVDVAVSEAVARLVEIWQLTSVAAFARGMSQKRRDLTRGIAHDLRSPLSSALMAIQLRRNPDVELEADEIEELQAVSEKGLDDAGAQLEDLLETLAWVEREARKRQDEAEQG